MTFTPDHITKLELGNEGIPTKLGLGNEGMPADTIGGFVRVD